MNYTIQCFVKKVVLEGNCVKSLTICPSGKSRIDGVEDQCLGLQYTETNNSSAGESTLSQVKLFPLDLIVNPSVGKEENVLVKALMGAKFHGCEIEIEVTEGQDANKIRGVTLL